MHISDKRVETLTTTECRELLDSHHFGRLAFVDSVGVLPFIIPINYLFDDEKVVFRTTPAASSPQRCVVHPWPSRSTESTNTARSVGASWCGVVPRRSPMRSSSPN